MTTSRKRKLVKRASAAPHFRERDPFVQVLVITKDFAEPACLQSLQEQDFIDYSIAIHVLKPRYHHEQPAFNAAINMVRNRNAVRRMALATDSQHFLLVDSDVVLPKNALSSLVMQKKDFIAGWYQCKGNAPNDPLMWPTAIMAGNTAHYFKKPAHSVVMADFTGLGCALVSRRALEKVAFRDDLSHIMQTNLGVDVAVDDSSQFCFDVNRAGYQLYMDGDVVCEHLPRKTTADTYAPPRRSRNA